MIPSDCFCVYYFFLLYLFILHLPGPRYALAQGDEAVDIQDMEVEDGDDMEVEDEEEESEPVTVPDSSDDVEV